MSKSTRRRSIRLENLQNDSRTNLNQVSRSPKNSPNTQFKNNLLNRNKLDIIFTKVSKPANDSICNQQPQRSIFRSGSLLFGPKDKINGVKQKLPNTSNSATNNRILKKDQDRSNGNTSCINSTSNVFKLCSIPEPSSATLNKNNSDSSITFYEPDSTVDDDLDSDLLFDSNGPIDESVLTKNTNVDIPIVSKSSFKRTCYETPKKNVSVKKLTQFKPTTPQKAKITVRKVKPNDRRKSQAGNSQDSLFSEVFSSPRNSTKNIKSNPTKKVVAASKRQNLNQSSQHNLQTPSGSNPIFISKSTGKTNRKNYNPPTLNLNSKPRSVSPELFVSDHDSNQISSNDLVLPSPDDSIQRGHTLVSRNRLKTPQDTNSVSTPPVTNSSHQMKKSLRYPLRSTTSSPVIYELPAIHRIRSNSSSASIKINDSPRKFSVGRSKIPVRTPSTPKAGLFSQCSSVHESLLNINTPRDTQTQYDVYDINTLLNTQTQSEVYDINTLEDTQIQSDVYDFVSNSPRRKPQRQKGKKKGNCWSQKSRTSRSTPAKKANEMKPASNSSILTPIIEPSLNASAKKKPQTPQTKTIFNPSAFCDLTNQISKKTRAASSRAAKKEENFLSIFSQGWLTPSQPSSIFNPPNSQGSRDFSLNYPQTFLNQRNPPSQRYSHMYGGMLAYIDNFNRNNTDTEMDVLCDLFKSLKINDKTSSFLTYRDPNRTRHVEKPYVKRIDKRENPLRKTSFLGNTFMNYRPSSVPIVEENELPFTPIPTKNVTNGINFRHPEYVAQAPLKSNDATEFTNVSTSSILKSVTTISRRAPNYFCADGEFSFDGFSDWN